MASRSLSSAQRAAWQVEQEAIAAERDAQRALDAAERTQRALLVEYEAF